MFRTILNYFIHVQREISISNGLPMKIAVLRDVMMRSLVEIYCQSSAGKFLLECTASHPSSQYV
jgi:hypothetical protein